MVAQLTTFFHNRWRTLLAGVVGALAGWYASRHGLLIGAASLVGWNVAAAAFVIPTGWILLTSDHADCRANAKIEDENRAVLMAIILGSVGVSLGAIIVALKESKLHAGHQQDAPWIMGLSILTLVMSWLVVQCLYTLHYAHRYFGDRDGDGAPDGGIEFPGEPPQTYRDFIYVSVCVGSTCQVSDFNITTTKFRNLVTTHAVITFVFNTMVLALGINIIGNLMGQ
jgi:uncharacterized membrane protein